MVAMNEVEKYEFKRKWDAAVSTVKDSKVDLSKIMILPINTEYKERDE